MVKQISPEKEPRTSLKVGFIPIKIVLTGNRVCPYITAMLQAEEEVSIFKAAAKHTISANPWFLIL